VFRLRDQGLTQERIANELGISSVTVAKWLAGQLRGDQTRKRAHALRLASEGFGIRETARLVGCATQSVYRWRAEAGL
jgi:transposase-like protein